MRPRSTALALFLLTVAAVPSLSELRGQRLIVPPPLPVYVPHHPPLPYLTFRPVDYIHGGYPYHPYAFPGHVSRIPIPFFFGSPIVRDPIIVLKRPTFAHHHKHHRRPTINFWLLARKDGPIYAVTDYWLDDETLHYVERDGTKASVPLTDVDLGFTKRLNRKLGTPFRLPQRKNGQASR